MIGNSLFRVEHKKLGSFMHTINMFVFLKRANFYLFCFQYHAEVKKHKCDECGKLFRLRATLKEHQIKHQVRTNTFLSLCPSASDLICLGLATTILLKTTPSWSKAS